MKEKILKLKEERTSLQKEGNILKEVEVLKEISNLSLENFGEESDEYLKSLNELGGTLKYIGKYQEAEQNLNLALEIMKNKYGENNLAYATTFLNLIEVYRFAGKLENLKEMYEKVIEIYQKTSSEETIEFAGICNNYGLYFQSVEDFTNAYIQHMKSLYIVTEVLDKEKYLLEYAVTLSNLFNPLMQAGNEKLAIKYLKESIEIFENKVGIGHPLYAASLNNMAVYYYNQKDFKNALNYFEKSAEICKKTMGGDSENYKNIMSNIKFIVEEFNL